METLLSPTPPTTMFLIAVPSIRNQDDWVPVRILFDRETALAVYQQMAANGRIRIYEVGIGSATLIEVGSATPTEVSDAIIQEERPLS